MGIRHDIEEGLEKYEITKIDGQPGDEELNKLTKELTNALGSVATELGGGEHGHVGLIVEDTATPIAVEYPPNFAHGRSSLQRQRSDREKLAPRSIGFQISISVIDTPKNIILQHGWGRADISHNWTEGRGQERPRAATRITQQSIGIQTR